MKVREDAAPPLKIKKKRRGMNDNFSNGVTEVLGGGRKGRMVEGQGGKEEEGEGKGRGREGGKEEEGREGQGREGGKVKESGALGKGKGGREGEGREEEEEDWGRRERG